MTDRLSATFGALADPTRRAILAQLTTGEATVNELAAPHQMSLPSVSRHLKVLQQAGLVTKTRSAQRRPCRLDAGPLREADVWLATYREFFDVRLDRLVAQIGDTTGTSPEPPAQVRPGTDRTTAPTHHRKASS